MPKSHPVEFRQRAVDLAPTGDIPVAQVARDLGISESCLRRWMSVAAVNEGRTLGQTFDERADLVRLRREKRVLELEIEILKRASAYFAR
jgi:transposase